MLTLSSTFEADRFKQGTKLDTIIAFIDQDATVWIFSTAPVIIDYEVGGVTWTPIPLIRRTSGISEGFDPITRKWQVGDVKITLSNIPFQREDGGSDMLRASDLLTNVVGCDVTIYLIPSGLDTVPISDLLTKFVGRIHGSCDYDMTKCVLTLKDKGAYINKSLPLTTLLTDYSNAIDTTKSVPLVYGSFTQEYDSESMGAGNGLAKGYRIDRDIEPEYVFADHILKSLDTPYVTVQSKILAYPNSFYSPANTPYFSTIAFRKGLDPGFVMLNAPFMANGEFPFEEMGNFPSEPYDVGSPTWININVPSGGVTDKSSAYDGDPNTRAIITDNIRDSGVSPPLSSRVGAGFWGVNSSESLWAILDSHNQKHSTLHLDYRNVSTLLFNPGGGTHAAAYMCYGGGEWDGIWQIFAKYGWFGYENYLDWKDVPFGPHSVRAEDITGQYNYGNRSPFGIICISWAHGTSGATGDDDLHAVGELRLRVQFPELVFPEEAWLSCEGLAFGSWIDGAGRSNDYNAGNLIEDPAFIIESLLRDYLDLADDDIDYESFDTAADGLVISRLNIDSPIDSNKLIKQLSEQSTFCYVYSGAGKARLISLTNDVDTVATIPWSHIGSAGIKVNQTDRLVNYLVVDSRWIPEFNEFTDQDTYQDTESQDQNNKGQTTVKWKNINGDTAEYIAAHYAQSPNHLWSRPHTIIEFETLGFSYANIELGDRIELDSESIDSQIKLYGGTWYGHKFMVTGITQYTDKTRIVAIELIFGYPGQLVAEATASAVDPAVVSAGGYPSANIPEPATAIATAIAPKVVAADAALIVVPDGIANAPATALDPTVEAFQPLVVTPGIANATASARNTWVDLPQGFDYRLPLHSHAIGHWRFESDLTDESSNSNDLTGVNIEAGDYVVGYTTPDIDTALDLDVTEYCYIAAADASDFDPFQSSFTVEAIFSTTDVDVSQILIGKWNGWKPWNGYQLRIDYGRITFTLGAGTSYVKEIHSNHNTFANGDWVYVAVVVDRVNHVMKLYENGIWNSIMDVDISDFAGKSIMPEFNNLIVGDMNGKLDEATFIRHALTQHNIFDRGQGVAIRDNWALDFTGAAECYGKVLHDEGLNCLTGLTIEMWIKKADSLGGIQCLIVKSFGTYTGYDYQFLVIGSAGQSSLWLNTATHSVGTAYRSDICDNTWNHIVGTIDGTDWKIYLNGSEIKSKEQSALPSNNDDGDVYLGIKPIEESPYYEYSFDGSIDNLCIYNRALSQPEVTANYNAGNGTCSPITDGLMAYWRFDEGSGTTTYDAVGPNHIALLTYDTDPPDFAIGKVQCNY